MIPTADFANAESPMAESESIALTITQESDYAFRTITESVRAGVPVELTVRDGTGAVLRVSDHAT